MASYDGRNARASTSAEPERSGAQTPRRGSQVDAKVVKLANANSPTERAAGHLRRRSRDVSVSSIPLSGLLQNIAPSTGDGAYKSDEGVADHIAARRREQHGMSTYRTPPIAPSRDQSRRLYQLHADQEQVANPPHDVGALDPITSPIATRHYVRPTLVSRLSESAHMLADSGAGSSWISPRSLSLAALALHYSALTLFMHHSRVHRDPTVPNYKASSAVVLTEAGKLVLSTLLALRDVTRETRDHMGYSRAHTAFDSSLLLKRLSGSDLPSYSRARSLESTSSRSNSRDGPKSSSSDNSSITPETTPSDGSSISFDLASGNEKAVPPRHPPDWTTTLSQLKLQVFGHGWWLLAVPAIMFTIQNNLQYLAASNLSVPLFQITYQLKILTTALCSVLLLQRSLSNVQWLSLLILSLGVGAVQLSARDDSHDKGSDGTSNDGMNQLVGLIAVTLACMSSGFASTFFERCLKSPALARPAQTAQATSDASMVNVTAETSSPRSSGLWVRNVQLSIFGLAMSLVIVIFESNREALAMWTQDSSPWWWDAQNSKLSVSLQDLPRALAPLSGSFSSFLDGFSPVVWFVVLLQIVGGLLAACVIKVSSGKSHSFAALMCNCSMRTILRKALRPH
ncbi:uncharacterized protein L969DRAFT_86860 [Mixia osmundae IAM 14324]|uniref:uncharacterized protein n=1 Tax=Mixia osmundae (strain CBS 9802 / IAM 14324 / JCM 22182 / KY 12970) TaxID=764103 RepID=UPI0004A5522F|nr:uncharacterized protein L969DRAFT_86860 [Mixia osmundae IAM 14324]KEI40227.1 hypothetical protein L969DRAFT_86860 [Mixia osmundae IAM 14324]